MGVLLGLVDIATWLASGVSRPMAQAIPDSPIPGPAGLSQLIPGTPAVVAGPVKGSWCAAEANRLGQVFTSWCADGVVSPRLLLSEAMVSAHLPARVCFAVSPRSVIGLETTHTASLVQPLSLLRPLPPRQPRYRSEFQASSASANRQPHNVGLDRVHGPSHKVFIPGTAHTAHLLADDYYLPVVLGVDCPPLR